jgi:hypothetical protein
LSTTKSDAGQPAFTGLDEAVLQGVTYERLKQENPVGRQSLSCKIGEYLLFSDMGGYQVPGKEESHLILMKPDGTERKIIYSSPNLIGHVQLVDENRVAFSVLKLVEPELALYDYFYFNLRTGVAERFSENPTGDPNAAFMYPVWVDGNMIFQMLVNNPDPGAPGVNGIMSRLYCKNAAGETVLLAEQLSNYYIDCDSVYILESGAEAWLVCNLDGSDLRQTGRKAKQRIWGDYLADFSAGKPVFTNLLTNEKAQMTLVAADVNFRGWSGTHAYFLEEDGIYRVAFASGEVEQVADKAGRLTDIYDNFVVFAVNESERSFAEDRPYIACFGDPVSRRMVPE